MESERESLYERAKRRGLIKDPFDKIKISKEELRRVKGLERRLRKLSDLKLKSIGFTVFTSPGQDEWFNICYRKNMPIGETGASKMFYEKNSPAFNPKNSSIKWPYTGFVKGNIISWCPILIVKLIKLLKVNHYSVDDFIDTYTLDLDNG